MALRDETLPCEACARRSWLVTRLSDNIQRTFWRHEGPGDALRLTDEQMIVAHAGSDRAAVRREYEDFHVHALRVACAHAGVVGLCRHDPRYPTRLNDLPNPPAVLYVFGNLGALDRVVSGPAAAIVGARRASPYGLEQARLLADGLAHADVAVVSGMALGIDAAAHTGALAAQGTTVAVLACGPDRVYPTSNARLHERIVADGAVVSELPPGTAPRRWYFPVRNRIVAAIADATVVVVADQRSGSMVTARAAEDLGRALAAVPGLTTSPLASGPHALLAGGAAIVRSAPDVLQLPALARYDLDGEKARYDQAIDTLTRAVSRAARNARESGVSIDTIACEAEGAVWSLDDEAG